MRLEPRTSGIGSKHSTNRTKTSVTQSAKISNNFCGLEKLKIGNVLEVLSGQCDLMLELKVAQSFPKVSQNVAAAEFLLQN